MIWCCVIGSQEIPIGLVTNASLNTSEETETSGYFGGSTPEDVTGIPVDGNGDPIGDGYVNLGGELYELCANSSSCVDELNLTADFCLVRGCTTPRSTPIEPQQYLRCEDGSKHIRLKYVDDTGTPITLYDAPDAKINSKNRTFPGGADTEASFDVTFEIKNATYDNCFH